MRRETARANEAMREAARLSNQRMIRQQEVNIRCSQRLLVNRQLSASSNFIASREASLHVPSLASVTCHWIGGNYMLVSWTRKNSDPRKFPELGSPLTLSLGSQAGIAWDRRAVNLISVSLERDSTTSGLLVTPGNWVFCLHGCVCLARTL